jgi:hypothetical protein
VLHLCLVRAAVNSALRKTDGPRDAARAHVIRGVDAVDQRHGSVLRGTGGIFGIMRYFTAVSGDRLPWESNPSAAPSAATGALPKVRPLPSRLADFAACTGHFWPDPAASMDQP